MNYEEFKQYYLEKKKFPFPTFTREKPLNEAQLKTKFKSYEKFLASKNKKPTYKPPKAPTIDLEWKKVLAIVWERDNSSCRLLRLLTQEEFNQVKDNLYPPFTILDGAHVIRRSNSANLKYNPDNVVLLSRLFHSRIDSYSDPITGKSINAEQVENWWKRIVGEDYYNKLIEQK